MEISVYGTPTCARCKDVVNFLQERETSFTYIVIGKDMEPEEVNSVVGRLVRAVPVIMVDGDELSFNDLKERLSSTDMLNLLEL